MSILLSENMFTPERDNTICIAVLYIIYRPAYAGLVYSGMNLILCQKRKSNASGYNFDELLGHLIPRFMQSFIFAYYTYTLL